MALRLPAAPAEQPLTSRHPVPLDQRTRRAVLGSLALVMLLASLDSTVVGTALPQIVSDLHGNDVYEWVFTIYLLTMTVSMPMYAAISDRIGRTPVLFFGVALFLAASALCGLSTEMWQLVLFRGIQGLGAGALAPVVVAIVGDLFSPADRARYQPLLGSVFLFAFLLGPTVGGVLTDTVGWTWVFYINLPLGLFALLVIWRVMPRLKPAGIRHHFDVLGVGLFALAVVPMLIGLRNLPDGSWTDPAVGGLMLLGVAFAALFLVAEYRAAEPIIPVRMFRNPTFAVGSIVILLAVAGLFVSIVYMPRYFQFVRGASATESGWQLMTLLVGVVIGAIVGGQIAARTGHWKVLLLVMMGIGLSGMVLLTGLAPDTPPGLIWAWMFMAGFGIGPVTSLLTAVIQSSVAAELIGTVSGTVTFFRQFGASLWLAVSGTVFATVFNDQLPGRLVGQGVPDELAGAFGSRMSSSTDELTTLGDLGASILAALPPELRAVIEPLIGSIVTGIHEAFSAAVGSTFWIGIVAVGAAIVVLALLREVPFPKEEPADVAASPAEQPAAGVA